MYTDRTRSIDSCSKKSQITTPGESINRAIAISGTLDKRDAGTE
jgi:hypothetical protein